MRRALPTMSAYHTHLTPGSACRSASRFTSLGLALCFSCEAILPRPIITFMSEPVFNFDDRDPAMQLAYDAAQRTFKYFWRELSWERRRIVPGLDMAMVKLPFTDGPRTDGNAEYEHMWIG